MMYVFEIYPIRHQDKRQVQLWQWRLKFGRKTMACGVEMGDGGRHGYASKRDAFDGLKDAAKVFGVQGPLLMMLDGHTTRAGTYILTSKVQLVIKEKK